MKHSIVFAALGLTAFGVVAQEVGQVVSSTPIVQQVAVPRQVCQNQPMVVQHQPSGVGGIIGAIAGAAIGSQFGGGPAMVAGTVGGALVGNSIEGQNSQYVQNVPQCGTQTSYENRTVAWNVTYDYAGRRHQVQMPYDPGPTIRLNVSPVGGTDYRQGEVQQGYVASGPVVVAPPMQVQAQAQGLAEPQPSHPYPTQQYHVQTQPQPYYVQPAQVAIPVAPAPIVYSQYPVYPAYPAYPAYRAYPPIGLSLGFNFGGGHRHHRRHR